MTFCLYRSNRVEELATALAQVVRRPLSNPFARECIVVQGPGMERWLSAHLCSQLGVWANPWFPFPRGMVELALDAALGEVPVEQRVYRPETLALLIAKALEDGLDDPVFEQVARYVQRDTSSVGKLALASLLATTYDQYLVYRPDQVLAWESGTDQHFQAKLWRKLTLGMPSTHIARRMQAFQRALSQDGTPELNRGPTPLPERISLFGISTLPPAFLHLLTQLSEHLDVHLFLLTPSPQYWGDLDRRLARGQGVRALLSSLGRVSREFVDLLLEGVSFDEPFPELFELKTPRTLLEHLQSDLANLTDRDPSQRGEVGSVQIAPEDRSLSVHVCHSPVRELEVLRDALRARFESDKTLEPHDVVVLAPDIERYAPAIEAVFAQRDDARDHIPYRIADRRAAQASVVIDAFVASLDLASSRLTLSEVLDFLHRSPVRERFDLEEAELELLAEWLIEAGARWGVDAAHRARVGQPSYGQNSFRFALDRLFVGYASASDEQRDVLGVLPFSEVEGEQALLLGRFARFAETLFSIVDASSDARTIAGWSAFWLDALPRLLSDRGELGHEHHGLRTHLAGLATDANTTGYGAEVTLEAFRLLLEARFERGRANLGFLTSGVTFCEHVPMRAIPFRVVAMVGMDDEAFPRRARRPSFDLIAEKRRVGDHDVRDDDRQLFLEALLSARDAVLITHVGRSAKDDSERPASVLVDQLLRVVDRHFVISDSSKSLLLAFEHKRPSEQITSVHALHRFDPRYFSGSLARGPSREPSPSDLFSYDETAASAARALLSAHAPQRPFVRSAFPAVAQARIGIEQLVQFFRAPQRAFVRERLRVRLPQESEQIPDREPTALDALARFQLHDRLLTGLAQKDRDERRRLLTQEGRLPPGTTGQVLFEDLERTVQSMWAELDVGRPVADLALEVKVSNHLIHGKLSGLHELARVELTAAAASDKHKLSTWIRHLALCVSDSPIKHSRLVARADATGKRKVTTFRFGPVPRAEELLSELIGLYLLGLQMPLPLLKNESSAYAKEFVASADHHKAMERAHAERAKPNRVIDSAEKYVRQVWPDEELDALEQLMAYGGEQQLDFATVSARALVPMLEHLKEQDNP